MTPASALELRTDNRNEIQKRRNHLPRSSNGSGSRFFNPQTGVRFSYGVLNNDRVEVQLEARLFWEQEGFGSTPRYPT